MSELFGLGVSVHGGAGGPGGSGSPGCSSGPTGAPIAGVGGTATALAGPARSFEASSPVREGQSLVLRFRGVPGELVFVAASTALEFAFVPELQGVRVVAPTQVSFQGVVPAAGVLEKTVPIQDLGAGVEGAVVGLQAAFFAAATGIHLGPPSVAVLLDASL